MLPVAVPTNDEANFENDWLRIPDAARLRPSFLFVGLNKTRICMNIINDVLEILIRIIYMQV